MTNEQKWQQLCELLPKGKVFKYDGDTYVVMSIIEDDGSCEYISSMKYIVVRNLIDLSPALFKIADLPEVEKIFAKPSKEFAEDLGDGCKGHNPYINLEATKESRKREFEALFPVGKKFKCGPFEYEVIEKLDSDGSVIVKFLTGNCSGQQGCIWIKDLPLWKAYFEEKKKDYKQGVMDFYEEAKNRVNFQTNEPELCLLCLEDIKSNLLKEKEGE